MSCIIVPGIFYKAPGTSQLFTISWAQDLLLPIASALPARDIIDASAWAFDADSPTTGVTIGQIGYDPASATTWVILAGGTDQDVIYLNNTITTRGASVNTIETPPQTLIKQLRIKVRTC